VKVLKDQREVDLVVMIANQGGVFQNQVSEKVVQIDSRAKAQRGPKRGGFSRDENKSDERSFRNQPLEKRGIQRSPLTRKNLRAMRNPSLKEESGQKILANLTNREKEKNPLTAQNKSIKEKISIQVLKRKSRI
jgi:hypothetical protein